MEIKYHKRAVKFINSLKSKEIYDPDYTKLLPDERAAVEEALEDYKNGKNISDGSDIDW